MVIMNCIDFEYDGKRLSDFNSMIGYITNSSGAETYNIGSQLKFNTVYVNSSNKFNLASTQYSEAYTTTFQICRNFCDKNNSLRFYNDREVSSMIRWLNQRTFKKFKPIYSDLEYFDIYYNASFNVSPIRFSGQVIGFEVTMQTNAPFGFYEPTEYHFSLTGKDNTFTIYDTSDEIGSLYPDLVQIELLSGGNLKIESSRGDIVIINNCLKGETIEMIGEHKIIRTSSEQHTALYNDFNYNFLKIHNDYDNTENTYTVSLPCKIHLSYSPICKGGVI